MTKDVIFNIFTSTILPYLLYYKNVDAKLYTKASLVPYGFDHDTVDQTSNLVQ